ncbi:polysaccharide deacetylase family protein [Pinibacter soli]|uniref:DUF3473 domain-containing protein n=1 Tax=Pinibacter soli TaxID=3044211 RepID=A0ABT6RI75_9BACT|nr:polysaccharide deacetylase family protein [Pinibacter soli]MDI3322228.1 DUF3473 domain-containing protein [Pinibacter soli]
MKNKPAYILLSFDVEEFDLPLEYGQIISAEEQMATGFRGLQSMQDVLTATDVKTTLFTTAHFAQHYPAEMLALAAKHEIASHTFYHSEYETSHLLQSRKVLSDICKTEVTGLRMPRLRKVEMSDVFAAGYTYDSSINPTYLPGRYNNLKISRTVYKEENIVRVPTSVSPHLRIPLFWLAFKNLPYLVYKNLAIQTLKQDGYLCLYFHPWELTDISQYKVPGYTKRHSANNVLKERMIRLIKDLSQHGEFITTQEFLRVRLA